MIKRILITLIILINTGAIYAQQYTAKNLIGRWQDARRKQINMVFYTDSSGALVTYDGILHYKINYSTKLDKDIIEFRYTEKINIKNPGYHSSHIKFLNDSTFLMRNLWAIPKNADTSTKNVFVFSRMKKEQPGTEIKPLTYKNLLGQWVLMFKNEPRTSKLNFIDSNRVVKKNATSVILMDYIVDFTKQPITIDFYIKGEPYKQAFLVFESRDDVRIEFFDPGKRKDHFTPFGQNYMYRREKPIDAAIQLRTD